MDVSTGQYHVVSRKTFSLWMLLAVVVAGGIGMATAFVLRQRIEGLEVMAQWNIVGAAQESIHLLRIVVTPVLSAVAAMAMYLALVGSRTIVSKCSPPPGSWILEGQEVKTGHRAAKTGWAMVALGLLLLSSSLLGLQIAWAGLPRMLTG